MTFKGACIPAVCGGIIGGTMGYLGYNYSTWPFWVVLGAFMIALITMD